MKLTKGTQLTAEQRREVLRAFVHRKIAAPAPAYFAEHYHDSDDEWIDDHAFYIKADGHLSSRPAYCEPHYLADDQ